MVLSGLRGHRITCAIGLTPSAARSAGSVAVTLNYHGELLVFSEKILRFSKRSGKWVHYVHDNAVSTMAPSGSRALRTAVYESCLDVSFARTGGCIAIVQRANAADFPEKVAEADRIQEETSLKTRLFSRAAGQPFAELDRRLRQELLALDGAVAVDHIGNVLAAGAIVKVPGGSDGGGRLAAAKELSSLGLGIKISADGPIQFFKERAQVFEVGETTAS